MAHSEHFIRCSALLSLALLAAAPAFGAMVGVNYTPDGKAAIEIGVYEAGVEGQSRVYVRSKTIVEHGTLQADIIETYMEGSDGYVYVAVVKDGTLTELYRYPGSEQDFPAPNEPDWWLDHLDQTGDLGSLDDMDWGDDYGDWSNNGNGNGGGYSFYTPIPGAGWLLMGALSLLPLFRQRKH